MQFLDLICIATITALTACGTAGAQTASAGVAAQTSAPAEAATLTLTFTGIEAKRGTIMLALYDEAGWSGGRPIRSEMLDASAAVVGISITGLPAGRYGVKAFHDINGNGKMDSNPFGMPTEPYAFSNDAKGQRGPASWSDAAFTVTAGGNAQTITIR